MFEERPTKLEIPNSNPIGDNMDGMDDMNNTAMPPMGAEDMGMDGQMGGDPNAMVGQDPINNPMGAEDPNAMGDSDDEELMNIVNGMSTEDKAAVIKYAKSMADDSEGTEMPQGDAMPMESKRSLKSIIDETINDILDKKEGTKRPEKKMPRQYKGMKSPFKSPF